MVQVRKCPWSKFQKGTELSNSPQKRHFSHFFRHFITETLQHIGTLSWIQLSQLSKLRSWNFNHGSYNHIALSTQNFIEICWLQKHQNRIDWFGKNPVGVRHVSVALLRNIFNLLVVDLAPKQIRHMYKLWYYLETSIAGGYYVRQSNL